MRLSQRAIVKFRGDLIEKINAGTLASSTARARMGAIIQFYRYAEIQNFINSPHQMWKEWPTIIPYYDSVGFQRTMIRATTDLSIPNRAQTGNLLEDGLLPLSDEHMTKLMEFTSKNETRELHLMLWTGFLTGARLGSINTLRIEDLEQARCDSYIKEFSVIRVGPGTTVATKFNVKGELLVPDFLLRELKEYAYSTKRLKRESKAQSKNKSILFLTRRGEPYSANTISRIMTSLRISACRAGLKYMERFKFHQTRSTYGTWLMKLALGVTTVPAAVEFVKHAMLHKHESTTFRYIKFLDNSKGKQEVAEAFNKSFTGLKNRKWNSHCA